MRRFLCILLTVTMLLGCTGLEFVSAAASLTTKDGFLDVEAEDLSFDKSYLEKTQKNKLYSNSYGLSVKSEDKTEPAASDPAHLDLSFTADKAGTYTIWMRHTAEVANKSGQNVFLSVQGGEYKITQLTAAPEQPAWVKLATATTTKDGEKVSVKIRRRQQYAIVLDRFIITNDAGYTPNDAALGLSGGAPAPTATATATSKPSGPAPEMSKKGGAAFIEAESIAINSADAAAGTDSGASDGKVVTIINDHAQPAKGEAGAVEFSFVPEADGAYALWMRVKPTSPNKRVWCAVGDSEHSEVRLGGEKDAYHWAGIAAFNAKKGEKLTIKITQASGWFTMDCFAIGKNPDDKTMYTPDDKDFGLSGAKVGDAPELKAESKGEYPYVPNNIDKMKGGVALLLDTANAYAKDALTMIDPDNAAVVATTVNDRTLVPIRFIAESFGATVGWDEDSQTASVALDGKNISIVLGKAEMNVDGTTVALDVAAESMYDRTMLPLRAISESLNKNVFWDDRGLILITDKATVIDKEADAKLIDIMLGSLKTGKLALNYAAAPHFTQSVIDKCAAQTRFTYTLTNQEAGQGAANALYYLTLAARTDETIAASDGTLAKDAALTLLRSLIAGGNEPLCSTSCFWSHSVVSAALLLVKNTPVIYDELTQDEIDRIELLEKCLAIAGNWGYNDDNNYATGPDLKGNFGKEWNPNHRHSYLPTVLMGALYFGSEELDKIYTSFSYDEYMKKLEEYGFTNIIGAWSNAGKDLMENGGKAVLVGNQGINDQKPGDPAGEGKGVKIPFKYKGLGLNDLEGIYVKLLEATYKGTVVNGFGTDCYIVTGESSPMLGYEGMMYEFAAGDGYGIRSKAGYCFDSFMVIMPVLANMKMFGAWDSQSDDQKLQDTRMYVGNTDFIFKSQQGYQGYSNGSKSSVEYESSFGLGYMVGKDLWVNFHNMGNEDITIATKPTLVVEPYNGITEPPAGAYESSESLGDKFADSSYFDLGKKYTGKVTAEFDLVFGPDTDGGFNGVVMFDEQGATDRIWGNTNVMIQCSGSKINIRNGSKYEYTGYEFAPNFRFHFKVEMDASKKTYSVWMTPTHPTKGAEKQVAKDVAFRTNAAEINNIGDLILATEVDVAGSFWVENLKLSE